MKISAPQKGFTLIELLIVISIISLLSTIILGALQQARLKANDAKRLSEIRQLQVALELYFDDYGRYPDSDGGLPGGGNWDTPGNGTFLGVLAAGGYMPNIKDPTTNDFGGNFRYYRYPATGLPSSAETYGCSQIRPFYVIEIMQFQSFTGKSPASPGFKCATRDWENDSGGEHPAWVAGKFEN